MKTWINSHHTSNKRFLHSFYQKLNCWTSYQKNILLFLKQTSQIRQTLKSKSYQQAGLVTKAEKPGTTQIHPQQPPVIIQASSPWLIGKKLNHTNPFHSQEQVIFQPQSIIKIERQLPETLVVQNSNPTTSQITLNRLNAQQEEIEMDVEGFQGEEVKIEYRADEVSWDLSECDDYL